MITVWSGNKKLIREKMKTPIDLGHYRFIRGTADLLYDSIKEGVLHYNSHDKTLDNLIKENYRFNQLYNNEEIKKEVIPRDLTLPQMSAYIKEMDNSILYLMDEGTRINKVPTIYEYFIALILLRRKDCKVRIPRSKMPLMIDVLYAYIPGSNEMKDLYIPYYKSSNSLLHITRDDEVNYRIPFVKDVHKDLFYNVVSKPIDYEALEGDKDVSQAIKEIGDKIKEIYLDKLNSEVVKKTTELPTLTSILS